MRSRFDEQLALLNRELIEMGSLCEEVIALASRALTEGDRELAAKVAISSHEPQSALPEGFFRGGLGRGVFTRGALPPASYWLICAPFCPWFPWA